MSIKLPIPHAQTGIVLWSALLRSGQAVLPNGAKVFLPGDRPRSITVESRSNVLWVTSSGPLQMWYKGARTMLSDTEIHSPTIVEMLAGVESHGIRCFFANRQGFRAEWESELVLKPLSRLVIEAPVLRRFAQPDVDYIALRENGTGEIVINSMVSVDLEFV